MRILMVLTGILIATAAAAEEPDVEARLEEAAAAGAAVEKVLVERQPVREPGCQGGDCGTVGMKSGRTMKAPDVPSESVVADDVVAKTNEPAAEMGGMGKKQRGGMGKMGGMHGGMGRTSEGPPQIEDPGADTDPSTP